MQANNNTSLAFSHDPWADGAHWTAKCFLLAGAIFIGEMLGHLQATCIGVIVVFVGCQGLLPYFRFAGSLLRDKRKCHGEKQQLQDIDVEHTNQLSNIDASDAGSIFKLIAAIKASEERLSKTEASDRFLEVAEQRWEAQLTPIITSAEQSSGLGLGGSLLGLISGLKPLMTAMSGSDLDATQEAFGQMFAAMGIMVTTTLVGCAGALLLIGLAAIGTNAVKWHVADLRMVAGLMASDGPDSNEDETDSLFGGDPE